MEIALLSHFIILPGGIPKDTYLDKQCDTYSQPHPSTICKCFLFVLLNSVLIVTKKSNVL